MRRLPALLVTAGLVALALTGCASSPTGASNCIVNPGSASKLVTAPGTVGTAPAKVSFPTPLKTTTLQRSTLITGKGAPIQKGDTTILRYELLDGATRAHEPYSNKGILTVSSKSQLQFLSDAIQCVPSGSRVAIAIPPKDSAKLGVSPATTYVGVFDILKTFPGAANGAPRPSQPGFPTVVLAPNGQPGIKINDPKGAPSTVKTEVLKAGSGKTVKKGDQVVFNYTAVSWNTNTVTGSSWQDGTTLLALAGTGQDSAASSSSSQTPALSTSANSALVGKKVGSQITVIVPSKETGSGSAIVYVIDILGIV